MAEAVGQLDYSNLKSAVAQRQGKERGALYGEVWSVMLRLQGGE